MPTSYKICVEKSFDGGRFGEKPTQLDRQLLLEGIDPPPKTVIRKSADRVGVNGFDSFLIEHEYEETALGRVGGTPFTKYIRKEHIKAYHNGQTHVLLLSGKKRAVLDFCKRSSSFAGISFQTVEVDLKELLTQLPNVKGVWFSIKEGPIRASALMGSHIEGTADFKKYQSAGDMSTLSFYFEYAGSLHPVMVTQDGTVVIQANYPQKTDEIEIVLTLKAALLDRVLQVMEKKPVKRATPVKGVQASQPERSNPVR